jgi:PASTA domain
MRPWVLAVGLVGVGALIAIVVYLWTGNVGGTETADLPNVVGKSRNEAEKVLRASGFKVKVDTETSSENAGKVIRQSPSSGEAEKGSMVAITVGEGPEKKLEPAQDSVPAPGHNLIQDSTGGLTIEVPPSWEVDTGQDSEGTVNNWSTLAGYDITSSITTAPSLAAWYSDHPPATGVYIVASRELAQRYTNQQLLYSGPWANWEADCAAGPYENFDRSPYSGKKQTWFCPSGRTFYHVVAAPEGRGCVVLLQLAHPTRAASEADRDAIQHILNTFDADCGNIAKAEVLDRSLAEVARVGAVGLDA